MKNYRCTSSRYPNLRYWSKWTHWFQRTSTPLDSLTHVVELTESTINANKRYFDKVEDVPTRAVSMGIGSIMKGKNDFNGLWRSKSRGH